MLVALKNREVIMSHTIGILFYGKSIATLLLRLLQILWSQDVGSRIPAKADHRVKSKQYRNRRKSNLEWKNEGFRLFAGLSKGEG